MSIRKIAPVLALLALAQLAGTGCIVLPTVADREVELVVSGQVTQAFTASGSVNSYSATRSFNLYTDGGIEQALSDAGVDVGKVTKVQLASLAYRVTAPEAGRSITGTIAVAHGGAPKDLVNPFGPVSVGAVTNWKYVKLETAGVTEINTVLAAILAKLQGTPQASGFDALTYTVAGTSSPASVSTGFTYELRLTLHISGKVKTQVVTGK